MAAQSYRLRQVLASAVVVVALGCTGAPPSAPPSTIAPATGRPPSTQAPTPTPRATAVVPTRPVVSPGDAWIVYQDGRGIRLVRPDGSDDHQLVEGPAGTQVHPDWSHDGRRIAYAVDDTDGTRDIWVVGVEGGAPERVVDCAAPCAWTDSPAWSPDDASLAYEHAFAIAGTPDGAGRSTVDVLDLATRVARPVFEAGAAEYVYSPRWSPDGAAIVFELDRFDSERLDASVVEALTVGIVDVADDPGPFRPVLPWDSGAAYPDWSPDGRLIALVLRETFDDWDGASDVYLVAPDGTGLAGVTTFGDRGGRALQPTFTPDGASIVFVAEDVIFEPRAGFVGVDGSGVRQMDDGIARTHPRLRPTP